ncbi:MAG: hypothetical protein BWY15_00830 [Firmicutes bacterium ADurb.Bin193]|nr:MAG: hypothetical protein BWY15_00830 [Firmicutes bacterium ADurb.Bin193]
MSDAQSAAKPLYDMKKTADFLICIDSDGCIFDTMEVKHKECFTPNIINHWNLQAISKYAREASEYVNLYSKDRGINRFPALIKVIDLLSERTEAIKRGFKAPNIDSLREWVQNETKLGDPALKAYIANHPDDEILAQTLRWTEGVNKSVAEIVRGVPPFPFVVQSFEKMQIKADVIVVSATPHEALVREWEEHGVAKYVKVIAGQEMGTKKECIAIAKEKGYAADRVLMIGDAPGDYKAALANDALYFPINPGAEDESWQLFFEEALDKFFEGNYAGEYEKKLIDKFDSYLPDSPPWKK